MEAKTEMPLLWDDQQSVEEIKHKLVCANLELQSAKSQAAEEIRKNKETIRQLSELLKNVCQERDEAMEKLHILFTIMNRDSTSPASPAVTASGYFSNTFKDHSHEPSTLHCINTTVPEPSSLGLPKQPVPINVISPVQIGGYVNVPDLESALLDKLVMGKPLPQKGKLLQAVMEAGPLLQTLLIGPVPKWRNPPPLQLLESPTPAPPLITKKAALPPDGSVAKSLSSSHPRGFSQVASSSVLNFARASSSCLNGGHPLSEGVNAGFRHYQVAAGKRRMIQ